MNKFKFPSAIKQCELCILGDSLLLTMSCFKRKSRKNVHFAALISLL